ncbi:hypothetical protein AbraIFM66950_008728 [Aspergillus brasiliensis]|nr:hypothetical protein AbraIFM66950_008728 [Aspergillus brasiliensis]
MEEVTYRCRTVHPLTGNAMVFTGLVVDAHLDEAVLRQTAAQLVKAWPVLGGQLHQSDGVGLMPSPPARLSISKVERFPKLQRRGHEAIPATPANVFLIRVTLLQDATLLCFGISHHLTDGTAAYDVIHAYCDLLAGRPIPSLLLPPDARGQRMSDRVILNDHQERSLPSITYAEHLVNFTVGFWRILLLIAPVAWSLLLRKICLEETLEERFIYLPHDWVGTMRKKALDTLATMPVSPQPFWDDQPTRNNIITAWFLKTVYCALPHSKATMYFYGPLSYRPVIEPPPQGIYWIHNSVGLMQQELSVAQIQDEPLALLAGRLRLATLRYTSPASIMSFLGMCEDHASQQMLPSVPSLGRMPMVMVTTWTGFDFSCLDFSGAACDRTQPARVLFVDPLVRSMRQGVWPSAYTLKCTQGGGYWMRAWNTPSGWKTLSQLGDVDAL